MTLSDASIGDLERLSKLLLGAHHIKRNGHKESTKKLVMDGKPVNGQFWSHVERLVC